MNLVTIGELNLTPFILKNEYTVNKTFEYKEWQDANGNYHRNIIRDRISGTFKLKFLTPATYTSFLNAIEAAKTGIDMVTMTLYCNNTEQYATRSIYFDFKPTMIKTGLSNYYKEFDVSVQEY